jgi:hypothetical protein
MMYDYDYIALNIITSGIDQPTVMICNGIKTVSKL